MQVSSTFEKFTLHHSDFTKDLHFRQWKEIPRGFSLYEKRQKVKIAFTVSEAAHILSNERGTTKLLLQELNSAISASSCQNYICEHFCFISCNSSVQFSHSVVSDSLRPHELQHARPPCNSSSHLSLELCSKILSGCLKPWIVMNPQILYFSLYIHTHDRD